MRIDHFKKKVYSLPLKLCSRISYNNNNFFFFSAQNYAFNTPNIVIRKKIISSDKK